MTPAEIRTALEELREEISESVEFSESFEPQNLTKMRAQGNVDPMLVAREWLAGLVAQLDALLSALPGETAPLPCPECRETDRVWAVGDGRYRCAACDVGYTLADVKPAGDTGPAPPRALVEVVREWQQAYADVGVAYTDTAVDAQRKLDRCWAAAEAVLAYPLLTPEAPETSR